VGETVEVVGGSDASTDGLDVAVGTGDTSTPVPVAQAETTSDTAAIQRIRHCYPPDAQSVTSRGVLSAISKKESLSPLCGLG
jgi:hypothetical protein